MAVERYRVDRRSEADLIHVLGLAASGLLGPDGGEPWTTRLFRRPDPAARFVLADESEASSALLAGVARSFHVLTDELNRQPERARQAYFVDQLRIPKQAAGPDRVLVKFTGVPSKLPLTVGRRTELLGGKRADGGRRTYRLAFPVHVLPAELVKISNHRVFPDGRELAIERALDDGTLADPFPPFGSQEEVDRNPLARALYLVSSALTAARAGTRLRVVFHGVGPTADDFLDGLSQLVWSLATDDGFVEISPDRLHVEPSGSVVADIALAIDACSELPASEGPETIRDGARPALRLSLPPYTGEDTHSASRGAIAFLRFRDVSLLFAADEVDADVLVTNVPAKPGTPFAPFGNPPASGTSFHVRFGTAMGLPLHVIRLRFMDAAGLGRSAVVVPLFDPSGPLAGTSPGISVELFRSGRWAAVGDKTHFADGRRTQVGSGLLDRLGGDLRIQLPLDGSPGSGETIVGQELGHFLRLRLEQADFGFSKYQYQVANFAREAAAAASKGRSFLLGLWQKLIGLIPFHDKLLSWLPGSQPPPAPQPPAPPTAPMLARVGLSYRSGPITLSHPGTDLQLWVGAGSTAPRACKPVDDGSIEPFSSRSSAWPGGLYLALRRIPEQSTLSMFLRIGITDGGSRVSHGELAFEYFTKGDWKPLPVTDGTRGLTRSGILRWRMPRNWQATLGSSEDEEGELYWVRVRARTPDDRVQVEALELNVGEAVCELKDEQDMTVTDALPLPAAFTLAPSSSGVASAIAIATASHGWGPEESREHLRRSARVTRHRGRAVTPQDAEDLVLDAFPELSLARCLRGDAPNSVVLITVPASTERFPLTDDELLEEVEAFLAARLPMNTQLVLRDPTFRVLGVRAEIRVPSGVGRTTAEEHVDLALRKFLHPRNRSGGSTQLGEPVALSAIERQLLSLDEVESVVNVRFLDDHAGKRVVGGEALDVLIVSAAFHEVVVVE